MASMRLVELHFWTATIGVVFNIASMWIAGVMQGLMWRAVNADGTLTYSFIESVERTYPFYYVRLLGGALFLLGMFFMAYNTWKTVASGRAADADTAIPAAAH
jgi:cytochrome c oxidase cbb3-type subunit 1